MTATILFEVLARDLSSEGNSGGAGHLIPLAEKMIAVCLSDLNHLRGYEKDLQLSAVKDPQIELELRQSLWQLYREWATTAEDLYQRVQALHRGGINIDGITRLNTEIGKIQARLTVKPEQIFKARQQVREGHIIPAKELRDELYARLRA